jgi:hypothetical protein
VHVNLFLSILVIQEVLVCLLPLDKLFLLQLRFFFLLNLKSFLAFSRIVRILLVNWNFDGTPLDESGPFDDAVVVSGKRV